MTRCWEGPLGAVRPLLAPSWLTAEPRTTASTRWPLRRASDSRSTSSTPTPSAQPVPSAAAANALHRPSGDRPRCRQNSTNMPGVAITVTPPASARSHSPERSACRPGAGDQRRRAGGVDRDRRALEAEGVGDPAGHDAAALPVPQVALESVGRRAARP